jgi:hypothetical protein
LLPSWNGGAMGFETNRTLGTVARVP